MDSSLYSGRVFEVAENRDGLRRIPAVAVLDLVSTTPCRCPSVLPTAPYSFNEATPNTERTTVPEDGRRCRKELSSEAGGGQRAWLRPLARTYAVKLGEWCPKTIPRALPLLLTGL
ncbi:hypothetical protein KM043_014300 [Ampulex compressa]|nr:hypothetical protein KM043_014300 [Ampulex compressa]